MKIIRAILTAFTAFFTTFFHLSRSFWRLRKKILAPKNLFHIDNILALGTLLIFFGTIGTINFEVVNPIGDAFSDVQLTDLSYAVWDKNSDLRKGDFDDLPKINQDITIVNIGGMPRYEIEEVLNYVNGYNPKVVAFDATFDDDRGMIDNLLVEEFNKTKNLVLVSTLIGMSGDEDELAYEDRNRFDTVITSHKKFMTNATPAFANMITTEGESKNGLTVTRDFLAMAINRHSNDTLYPWAVEVVKKYKPEALQKLTKRNNYSETINYIGNIWVQNFLLPDNYNKSKTWDKGHFQAIEYRTIQEAINPKNEISFDSSIFKNKIVLFGYLGNRIDIDESGEDLFYTPLNKKYVGKTPKDMYGMVVHANIIATILRGKYINTTNNTFMHIIGFLVTYLVFAAYRPIYDDHKIWYDGVTKFMGIFFSLALLFIIGIIFDILDYKIMFSAIWFACILLAGDWLEIYYGLLKNFFEKIHTNNKN